MDRLIKKKNRNLRFRNSESEYRNTIYSVNMCGTHCVENIYRWSAIRSNAYGGKKPCAIKCTAGVHRYISAHAHSVANVNKFSSKTIWCWEKSGKKDDNDGGGGSSSSGDGGNISNSNSSRATKKGSSTEHPYEPSMREYCWSDAGQVWRVCTWNVYTNV